MDHETLLRLVEAINVIRNGVLGGINALQVQVARLAFLGYTCEHDTIIYENSQISRQLVSLHHFASFHCLISVDK